MEHTVPSVTADLTKMDKKTAALILAIVNF